MSDARERFTAALTEGLAAWSIEASPAQIDVIAAHYEAVVAANAVMNLTRITEPVEAAVKHVLDSLALLLWLRQSGGEPRIRRVLDIGTGAGFPAVPLAVLRPGWQVLAIDGTRKKIDFLTGFAKSAGLDNLRVEHIHSSHRPPDGSFDVVTLRAVGSLANCVREAARHAARRGEIVVYKTAVLEDQELSEGEAAAKEQHCHEPRVFPYSLTLGDETLLRALFVVARR
jgi:16S rRNA (guanine527-N7)-methyltransferase